MGLLVTYLGLSSKRYLIVLLGAVMTAMTVFFELIYPRRLMPFTPFH